MFGNDVKEYKLRHDNRCRRVCTVVIKELANHPENGAGEAGSGYQMMIRPSTVREFGSTGIWEGRSGNKEIAERKGIIDEIIVAMPFSA